MKGKIGTAVARLDMLCVGKLDEDVADSQESRRRACLLV